MLQYVANIYQIFCKLSGEDFQNLVENANLYGMTPFLISVETMNIEIMQYLISECLCSIFAVNAILENALHICVKNHKQILNHSQSKFVQNYCIKAVCLLL
jgi:hypothetical protein